MATMSKWLPEKDSLVLRRVGKAGEECSELSKVCFRIVIQGLDGVDPKSGHTNREELTDEVADVLAQCELLIASLGLPRRYVEARAAKKLRHMAEWDALVADVVGGNP
jgi:hypothetical protein